MKKEDKRYYLTSYHGTKTTTVCTNEEYERLLVRVNKYNKRKKSKYIYGNITKEVIPDGFLVTAHIYTRLGAASTISDLLNYTSQYEKEELQLLFEEEAGMQDGYIPDINIAYYENKNKGAKEKIHFDRRIKYLPVLYKSDRKFLSKEYILRCLKYHVYNKDFGILRGLASELCFDKKSEEELEKMYITIDHCEHQNESLETLYQAGKELIEKYISNNEKDGTRDRNNEAEVTTSIRRLFDVGMYFKFCMDNCLRHSPLCYNEGPTEEKKKELKREEEERRVMELIKKGINPYEQMSLF